MFNNEQLVFGDGQWPEMWYSLLKSNNIFHIKIPTPDLATRKFFEFLLFTFAFEKLSVFVRFLFIIEQNSILYFPNSLILKLL